MSLSLSIITPCLNRATDVERAIQSVLGQGYQNVEHIVVDGGSTDGTLDVLARFPHLRVLSEKDRGMYDALNKGLELATGEIIGFLNTDDLYADGVFQPVMQCFQDGNIDTIAGKAQIFKEEKNGEFKSVLELSPPHPDKLVETAITGSTIFNAWFYRKSLIRQVGGFDPQYRISGDADLILRLALMGVRYLALESVHYLYRQHQDSLTFDMNSAKLLRAFQDHSLFIQKYIASDDVSDEVKALFRMLYANTSSELANQFRSEGKMISYVSWRVRASLNITSPVLRRLAL